MYISYQDIVAVSFVPPFCLCTLDSKCKNTEMRATGNYVFLKS